MGGVGGEADLVLKGKVDTVEHGIKGISEGNQLLIQMGNIDSGGKIFGMDGGGGFADSLDRSYDLFADEPPAHQAQPQGKSTKEDQHPGEIFESLVAKMHWLGNENHRAVGTAKSSQAPGRVIPKFRFRCHSRD